MAYRDERTPNANEELYLIQKDNELYFCAGVLSGNLPQAQAECMWLDPSMFADRKLGEYWQRTRDGEDVLKVANDLGVANDIFSACSSGVSLYRVDEYARMIAEYHYRRSIVKQAADLAKSALEGTVAEIQDQVNDTNAINLLTAGAKTAYTANDIHAEFQGAIAQNYGKAIMTNTDLDPMIGGLMPQEMTILASRPGCGKTAISLQMARCVARNPKYKVLYFSLEMPRLQLWARMACGGCGIAWRDVRMGKVNQVDLQRIDAMSKKLVLMYGDRFFVQDEVFTVNEMHQVACDVKPDLIVIDHLGEINWANPKEEEVTWYGKAARFIRLHMARKLGTHVILIHQLNRVVESRKDKRPILSDLRWSGDLEAIADIVLMLYREDYYDTDDAALLTQVPTEVWARKNRQGVMNGCTTLMYDLSKQWFYGVQPLVPNIP